MVQQIIQFYSLLAIFLATAGLNKNYRQLVKYLCVLSVELSKKKYAQYNKNNIREVLLKIVCLNVTLQCSM